MPAGGRTGGRLRRWAAGGATASTCSHRVADTGGHAASGCRRARPALTQLLRTVSVCARFPACYGQGGTACIGVPQPAAVLDAHAAVGGMRSQPGSSARQSARRPSSPSGRGRRCNGSPSIGPAQIQGLRQAVPDRHPEPTGDRARSRSVAPRWRLGRPDDLSHRSQNRPGRNHESGGFGPAPPRAVSMAASNPAPSAGHKSVLVPKTAAGGRRSDPGRLLGFVPLVPQSASDPARQGSCVGRPKRSNTSSTFEASTGSSG
jgi:hypothetical protein